MIFAHTYKKSSMDVLSDILAKIKLSSAVYFKSNFSSPWGMDIPQGPFAQFHIVTRGQCILKTINEEIQLFSGDLVVFPMGTCHWLADNDSSDRVAGMDVVQAIVNGKSLFEGDHISTTLICGHFEFDRNVDHPFLKELPEIIHIPEAERKERAWLESSVSLVIHEAGNDKAGSQIIVNKLGEILFVHTLRAFMERNSMEKGFITAMQDERIGEVLQAIHASPETGWQLSSLAQIAGMSRTSFSNKFKALNGETPLTYVTNWRILQAKELLKESDKTVGVIASEVGYQSEAAFNRVFKKRVAQTPLKYRQAV
ncbi:MAG: AraC family transcriptional regulator [Cytophagales bacterium]|nr:AraC family transcriptional regulator [Cytophagales bacterium]